MDKETKLWVSQQLLIIEERLRPYQYKLEQASLWPVRQTVGRFMNYLYQKSEELWAEWYMEEHSEENSRRR